MKHTIKINLLLVILLLLVPQTAIATNPPGDWWGKVTINEMKHSNSAIVTAHINNQLVSSSVVGALKDDYYLIHIEGQKSDIIYFKVNGFNVSQEPQNWSVGDHPELNLTIEIPITGQYDFNQITATKNETLILNNSDNIDTILEIKLKADITNETMVIKKTETNPTGKTLDGLYTLNKYIFIISENITNAMDSTILKIYYSDKDTQDNNIEETSIRIAYWNETMGEWTYLTSSVNTEENYVWTNLTHFSLYGLFGDLKAFCGDGTCNNGETCTSCPADCGQCPPHNPSDGVSTSTSFPNTQEDQSEQNQTIINTSIEAPALQIEENKTTIIADDNDGIKQKTITPNQQEIPEDYLQTPSRFIFLETLLRPNYVVVYGIILLILIILYFRTHNKIN